MSGPIVQEYNTLHGKTVVKIAPVSSVQPIQSPPYAGAGEGNIFSAPNGNPNKGTGRE